MRNLQLFARAPNSGDAGDERGTRPLLSRPLRWRELVRALVVLAAYGIAFTILRSEAATWATHRLFSLWFPAAGLRFAFLWIAGARWAPAAAVAELVVSVGSGTVTLSGDIVLSLVGVVAPCLVYGAVIHLVHARMRLRARADQFDPAAFAVAAVFGPIAACIAALPWALPLWLSHGAIDARLLFSALLVFTLGDLLGILILAPPLLWLAAALRSRRWSMNVDVPRPAICAELVLVVICAWALVWLLHTLGDGLLLAPVLLAACWCGLRGGRAIAWLAIVATAMIVLPLTGDGVSDALRVRLHMQLACLAVGAYLAGTYADAQARAILEIDRRDRLLLHAERLKTLRAMSVAVIHEVSQPLSTIAIEARALVAASQSDDPRPSEIHTMAALIARKADDLAELIRRLRGFGGSSNEGRTVHNFPQLVADVVSLAAPEARGAGVAIESAGGPEAKVEVNDVEIRQAMLNLIRNAISAAPKPDGIVTVGWSQDADAIGFWVENAVGCKPPANRGMGLGLIITRTIAQAHGGRLTVAATATGAVRAILHVPQDKGLET